MAISPDLFKNLTSVASTTGQLASTSNNSDLARVGSGLASGAATGAAIGSVIPGLGTAIGGAVGAIVGGLSGLFSGGSSGKNKLSDADLETQVKAILSFASSPIARKNVDNILSRIDGMIGVDLHNEIIKSVGLPRMLIKQNRENAGKYVERMLQLINEAKAHAQAQAQAQQTQLPKPTNQVDSSATSTLPVTLPDPVKTMGLTGEGLPSLDDLIKGGLDGMIDTITGSEKGKEVQQTVVKNWFVENWSKITTGALAFGIVVFTLVKSFNKKSKRR